MMRKALLFFLLFLYWHMLPTVAQSGDYQFFRNVTLGASASTVHSFAQDSLGVLWVGSNNGLYNYDGYALHASAGRSAGDQTFIYSIVVLDGSRMALGTGHGVLLYNYREDRYESFPVGEFADVRTLLLVGDKLWIGSLTGLFCYDIKKRKLLDYAAELKRSMRQQAIYALAYENNKMLIGTYNGLFEWTAQTNEVRKLTLPEYRSGNNQFVNSIFVFKPKNQIYIGTEYGLYQYEIKSGQLMKIPVLQQLPIKSMTSRGDHHLLLGTDDGVFVYHPEDKKLTSMRHDSRNPHSLANNIIWSIFTDRTGNVWMGTDLGFSAWPAAQSEKRIPIFQFTRSNDGNRFYKIKKDRKGWYWLGGDNGLIRTRGIRDDQATHFWYRMGDRQFTLPHNRIRDIYEGRDGQIWIASDGGVNVFDETTKTFRALVITDRMGQRNAKWAYNVFEDKQGMLWIATYMGGIFVLDKRQLLTESKQYVAHRNYGQQQGLLADFANQLLVDSAGAVWALFYNKGINQINAATGKVSVLKRHNGLAFAEATFMLKDQQGWVWIGQHGNLTRWSPNGKQQDIIFDPVNRGEVTAIADVGSYIWVATSQGVWQIDKKSLKTSLVRYGKPITALFYDQERHEVLLGGVDEVGVMPDSVLPTVEDATRNIVLTALNVNGQPFESEGYGIRYRKEINLRYDQNNLLLEFSDLSYGNHLDHRLAYSFEGENENWIMLDRGENRIQLANLVPGQHNLQVAKIDMSGELVSAIFTYRLDIHPPWYASLLAKIVYSLIVLGLLVWVLNFFRVRNTLKWERRERYRILESIRMKMDFLTAISHDLKTPLSLILAPVSQLILRTKNPDNKKTLEGVQRNVLKINSLIQEVMSFDKGDNQNAEANLMTAEIDLVIFMARMLDEWRNMPAYRHLEFRFYTEVTSLPIMTDVTKLESILNNLLSNAAKYGRERNGLVDLQLLYVEGIATIAVQDNGIGVSAEDLPYVFGKFYRSPATEVRDREGTGVGLYLVKNYCEQMGWRIGMTSTKGVGTRVYVEIPCDELRIVMREDWPTDRKKLLIVEDNAELAAYLLQALNTEYACRVATDGRQALELIERDEMPDIIVTDAVMPHLGGLDMAKALRKNINTAAIPIILLTAKEDARLHRDRMTIGIDAYLAKPFELELLKLQIQQLLVRKASLVKQLRMNEIAKPTVEDSGQSPDEAFLVKVTKLIEDNLDDSELSVQRLGDDADMGAKQLYRKIKQLTGYTPVEYIRSIRMKKAALLLKQRTFTVSEVMYMVGYSNASYFSKCFQSEFGVSPKRYMEQTEDTSY